MRRSLLILGLLLGFVLVSCEPKYVASVTDLQYQKMEPTSGYHGEIVKIYGRNFSQNFGENRVFFGDVEGIVLEYNNWDITVVVPKQEVGAYTVRVTTPTDEVVCDKFTYKIKTRVTTILGGDGSLSYPEGLALDKNGYLWIAQRGTLTAIFKMAPDKTVSKVANTELPWHGGFNADGDFYFAAKAKGGIYKVTPSGTVSKVNITGELSRSPMDVKFDASDNMWICYRDESKVVKVTDGQVVKSYDITHPTCIAFDAQGRALVGTNYDPNSGSTGEIYVINGDDVKLVAGTSKVGFVGGIAVASSGSVYFGDISKKAIRILTPGEGGDYLKGSITSVVSNIYPSDICLSGEGDDFKIYVACATDHVVKTVEIL